MQGSDGFYRSNQQIVVNRTAVTAANGTVSRSNTLGNAPFAYSNDPLSAVVPNLSPHSREVGMWHLHPGSFVSSGDYNKNKGYGPGDVYAAQARGAAEGGGQFSTYLRGSDGSVKVIDNALDYANVGTAPVYSSTNDSTHYFPPNSVVRSIKPGGFFRVTY